MAFFEYRCKCGKLFEQSHAVGEAPSAAISPCCGEYSARHFTPFQFSEDRTRFYRNPKDGSKHSNALGEDMPDSKKERDRILRQKGIELMTRFDTPAHVQRAADYGAHIRTGGERLPDSVVAEMLSPPREKPKTILELLREKAPRLGDIPTDRPIRGRELPPLPQNVQPQMFTTEQLVSTHPELAREIRSE